ncbi:MAG: HEAT repeat domain-containing protein [Bacillota bacterium]
MIDPYLRILLYIIVVLAVIITLLLLVIITNRYLISVNQAKFRAKKEEWEKLYLNYLQGDLNLKEIAELMKDEKQYYWLWKFFAPYLDMLDGSDFDKTKVLCREISLIEHYKRKLAQGKLSEKATAARALGALRCKESIPGMISLLDSKYQLLVQAAALGLAKSGDSMTFFPVARALLDNTYFTYEGATEILAAYGKSAAPLMIRFLEGETELLPGMSEDDNSGSREKKTDLKKVAPAAYNSVMIDLLGFFKYREGLPILHGLIKNADPETTVHILKAFLSIGEIPANFDLKPYLEHRYWVVRNFSARVWKLTGEQKAIPLLIKLLEDRNWWVRFNAAEALYETGQNGLEILKIMAEGPEESAAAISSYVLSRRGVELQA